MTAVSPQDKYYIRPDYQQDYIELIHPNRILEYVEKFGLPEDQQKILIERINCPGEYHIIVDMKKNSMVVVDNNGVLVDAFFCVN